MRRVFIVILQLVINKFSKLIVCWGLDENQANYTQKTVYLPITFSGTNFPVIITDHSVGGIGLVHSGAGMISNSTINISHSTPYTCWTCYVIIGY